MQANPKNESFFSSPTDPSTEPPQYPAYNAFNFDLLRSAIPPVTFTFAAPNSRASSVDFSVGPQSEAPLVSPPTATSKFLPHQPRTSTPLFSESGHSGDHGIPPELPFVSPIPPTSQPSLPVPPIAPFIQERRPLLSHPTPSPSSISPTLSPTFSTTPSPFTPATVVTPAIAALCNGDYSVIPQMIAAGHLHKMLQEKDRATGLSFTFYLMRLAPAPIIHSVLRSSPEGSCPAWQSFMEELDLALAEKSIPPSNLHFLNRYSDLGINLNFVDRNGYSPLVKSIMAGHFSLFLHLLNFYRLDPNFRMPHPHSGVLSMHPLETVLRLPPSELKDAFRGALERAGASLSPPSRSSAPHHGREHPHCRRY